MYSNHNQSTVQHPASIDVNQAFLTTPIPLEPDHGEVRRALSLLVDNGQVFEIRALKLAGKRQTGSGYFDNVDAAIDAVWTHLRHPWTPAFYITLNPVTPELLARCANRFKGYADQTTTDADIQRRTRLLIDFDPVRASGISSSAAEHDAALSRAMACRDWLSGQGWPMPLLADSGNGAHLIYAIDLANDSDAKGVIDHTLKALAQRFSDDAVTLDTSVGNAGRITKLYGSVTRKGDHTPERPHRLSRMLETPDRLEAVSLERLQAMATEYQAPAPRRHTAQSTNPVPALASDFWDNVNTRALDDLPAWVPMLFPDATAYKNGFRVASKHLNRDLEEDLGLQPEGIHDFGTERGYNPIGLVAEFLGCTRPDAAHWLCQRLGIDPATIGWKTARTARQPLTVPHAAKPPATPADLIDAATGKPKSQATLLIELGRSLDLFHNADGDHYAAIMIDGHREVWPLRSKPVKEWLQQQFFNLTGKGCNGPALNDALDTLGAFARFEGTERAVNYRVATAANGAIYIDLGGPDWGAIEITAKGWQPVATPPVMLTRNAKTQALPMPVRSGQGLRKFQKLFGLDDHQTVIITAWMLAALRGVRPFPVLILQAEQGAGKSTLARAIKTLTDPATNALRSPPKDETDLATAAANAFVLSIDNLSGISPALSDAFCRIATGGSISTRKLFTNDQEYSVEITRPVILNGIDELPTRPDLLDRSLIVSLNPVPENQRRAEADLWAEFERIRAEVFGDLLTATQTALANIATTQLDRLPRMADFALWIVAAEPALPCAPGDFIRYYRRDIDNHAADAVGSSAFGNELLRYLQKNHGYEGTAQHLLNQLNLSADIDAKNKYWPGTSKAAGNQVRRLAPALRRLGFKVDFIRTMTERTVRITEVGNQPSLSSYRHEKGINSENNKGLMHDGHDAKHDGHDVMHDGHDIMHDDAHRVPSYINSQIKSNRSNIYHRDDQPNDGHDGNDGQNPMFKNYDYNPVNDEVVL